MELPNSNERRKNFATSISNSPRTRWHGLAGAIAASLLLTGAARQATAGTEDDFNGVTNAKLTTSTNYSGGLPGSTSDVLLTTTRTSLTITGSSLSMESLSLTNGQTDYLYNATTSSTNSTITLGNSGGFTNVINGVSNDLLYATGSSVLVLQGANGSSGTGVLNLALASSGNFDADTGSVLQVTSVISGNYGITKTGAGTLFLGAATANTFTGTFSATAGSVGLLSNGALGANTAVSISGSASVYTYYVSSTNLINDAAAVSINGTGSLTLASGSETVGSLSGSSTGASLIIGDETISSTTYAGTFTVGDGTASTTFAGVISGTHAGTTAILTKQGSGTLILSGANTYTGITAVTGGTLAVTTLANGGSVSGLGESSNAAANVLLGTGTTLQYLGAATSSDRLFTINGTAAGASASLDASGTGAINLTNTGSLAYGTTNQTRTLVLTGTNTGANTLAATIADNGTGKTSVTKSGAGTWVLSGTNSYTGGTAINGGILNVGSSAALGTTGTISFGGGTLQYSASNTTNYSSRFSSASNQAFNIDTNGQNVAYTSLLASTGGTLTKLGAGTLSLSSGSSSYTSGTTISAGGLLLSNTSGTATGTGAVTVGTAGTLLGTGYLSATNAATPGTTNVIAVNGTLSPGGTTTTANTAATINLAATGGLTLSSSSTLSFDITSITTKDLVALTSTAVTLGGGTLALNLPNTTGTGIDYTKTYALLTGVSGLSGSFGSVTGYDNTDYTAQFALNGTEYDLSFVTVPEPATFLAGALLAGAAIRGQRRRRGLFAVRQVA